MYDLNRGLSELSIGSLAILRLIIFETYFDLSFKNCQLILIFYFQVNIAMHCKTAHQNGSDISSLCFSYDGKTLASRGCKYFLRGIYSTY